jgi:hypothetical protein
MLGALFRNGQQKSCWFAGRGESCWPLMKWRLWNSRDRVDVHGKKPVPLFAGVEVLVFVWPRSQEIVKLQRWLRREMRLL